jgi:hypothetical protein
MKKGNNLIAIYAPYDKRVENDGFLSFPNSNEYVVLAKKMEESGFELHSLDVCKRNNQYPMVCIFLDTPPVKVSTLVDNRTKTIVLLREAELNCPDNFKKERQQEFDLILTWKSRLVDNKRFLSYPATRLSSFKQLDNVDINNRKLCVLINSNLSSKVHGELYSERRRVVDWFYKNHKEDFDLWGYGWDKLSFTFFNRTLLSLQKPRMLIHPLYKGIAEDKCRTLSKYNFSICFENVKTESDYVSEKIFDSLLAKNVPIYMGAPNITNKIPKECFIDYRDFKSIEDLFYFLRNMSKDTYLEYLKNINSFLNSEKAQEFSLDRWLQVTLDATQKLVKENND